ncbi:hypothetical protein FB45DRAFT_940106 [Roridomyces roridus]|uniref:F-box domain-containing protein n=1 Tax=Roridomyces roridus TaxID=1738132 RepID=A0AAD7B6M1_9AGAR|nr:hypothetical protein FB45DRAFT_940106 [Roridomyces roridus]
MVLTRRAHRARMLITRWLPNEVLVEIIRHSPPPDWVALCRVSKLFHALTLPTLLRAVHLDMETPDKVASFCHSVIHNPERVGHIRTMRLINKEHHDARLWHYDLLMDTLQLMQQLETFHFTEYREVTTQKILLRLGSLTFPHLKTLYVLHSHRHLHDSTLRDFVNRHPRLTQLILWEPDTHPGYDWVGICLPNLRQYQGTGRPNFLLALYPHILTGAWLFWFPSANPDHVFEPLKRLTHSHQPFVLSNDFILWDDDEVLRCLVSASSHMPWITSLRMRSWEVEETGTTAIRNIKIELSKFTHLIYLALDFHGSGHNSESVVNAFGDQHKAVATWGNVCATLKACLTGDTAWRKVGEDWEVYPKDEFEAEAGFSELVETFF